MRSLGQRAARLAEIERVQSGHSLPEWRSGAASAVALPRQRGSTDLFSFWEQRPTPSELGETILPMPNDELARLQVPAALRPRVTEILTFTEEACGALLDDEYARLCTILVARLARKRPSPLTRGDTRIWAAGSIYALGRVNFLFDRSREPYVSADELAAQLGVAKTTMANKAARILKALDVGVFEPELSRRSILEQHPLAWMVDVNGFLVDARALPTEVQDEARRRGADT